MIRARRVQRPACIAFAPSHGRVRHPETIRRLFHAVLGYLLANLLNDKLLHFRIADAILIHAFVSAVKQNPLPVEKRKVLRMLIKILLGRHCG